MYEKSRLLVASFFHIKLCIGRGGVSLVAIKKENSPKLEHRGFP